MRKFIMSVALCAMASFSANATITFIDANSPQANEDTVLLNTATTGNTVLGTINGQPFNVDFSSTVQTLTEPSNGNARVAAADGTALTNLSISLSAGYAFDDLIMNPFIGGGVGKSGADATVTVNSVNSSGVTEAPSTFTYTLGNGQNFLTIVASGGEAITSVNIKTANGGFADLRQPRLSGPYAIPQQGEFIGAPEPSTWGLLAAGLGLIGIAMKRRRTA